MVFMPVIVMYPATTSTAIYTTVTAVIVRPEAVSEVNLTVYGRLRTVRSPRHTSTSFGVVIQIYLGGSLHNTIRRLVLVHIQNLPE